jgi:hypothetical protein
MLRTSTSSIAAALTDISETGARIGGSRLPREGEDVDLTVEALKVFGTVVWRDGEECGLQFETPLMPFELAGLRRRAGLPDLRKFTVDERVALEQWLTSVSR